jgi:hypothetical protein
MEKDPLLKFVKSVVRKVKLRRRYSSTMPKEYRESDNDWIKNNTDLVIQFLELLEETKRANKGV